MASKHETAMKTAVKKMSGSDQQNVREAYYKAMEGLQALADALESVGESDAVMAEHLIACNALQAMRASVLGKIV
jgi:hypothetical protein